MKLTEETRMELSSVEFMGGETSPESTEKQITRSSPNLLECGNHDPHVNKQMTNGHNGTTHDTMKPYEISEAGDDNSELRVLGFEVESYSHVVLPVNENEEENLEDKIQDSDRTDTQCYDKSSSVCDKISSEKRLSPNLSLNSDEFHLSLSDDDSDQITENQPETILNIDVASICNERNETNLAFNSRLETSCEGSGAKEDSTSISDQISRVESDVSGSDKFQVTVVEDKKHNCVEDGNSDAGEQSIENDKPVELLEISTPPNVGSVKSKELPHVGDKGKSFETGDIVSSETIQFCGSLKPAVVNEANIHMPEKILSVKEGVTAGHDANDNNSQLGADKQKFEVCSTGDVCEKVINANKNQTCQFQMDESKETTCVSQAEESVAVSLEGKVQSLIQVDEPFSGYEARAATDEIKESKIPTENGMSEEISCSAAENLLGDLFEPKGGRCSDIEQQDIKAGCELTSSSFIVKESLECTVEHLPEKRELFSGNIEKSIGLIDCPDSKYESEVTLQSGESFEASDEMRGLNSDDKKSERESGSENETDPKPSDLGSQEEFQSSLGNKIRFDEDEDSSLTSCSDETTSSGRKPYESDSEVNDKVTEDETGIDEITVEEMAGLDGESNPSNPSMSDCTKLVLHETSCSEMDCHESVNSSEDVERNPCRKRTLSQSDDILDTSKRKVNGYTNDEISFKNSASSWENQSENDQKRPGKCLEETEAKKIRIRTDSDENYSSETNIEKIAGITALQHAENFENDRLLKLQKAANLESLLSEPTKLPETSLDRSFTRIITGSPSPQALPFLRSFKVSLEKISRRDLEELVIQKMCEAITERSLVGQLRIRCEELEKNHEKDKEKFASLKKQMLELNMVLKRFIDASHKSGVPPVPVKVTRSVGLQVCQVKTFNCGASRPRAVPVQPCAGQPCVVQPSSVTQPPFGVQRPSTTVPVNKPPIACSSGQSDIPMSQNQKSPQGVTTVVHSPIRPKQAVPSVNPPALVPTSSSTSHVFPVQSSPPSVSSRNEVTPPRLNTSVPPLRQITTNRPRPSVPTSPATSVNSSSVQVRQSPSLPVQQTALQTSTLLPRQPTTPSKDVEVIDVIDKDESSVKAGVQISPQQQHHQQKQAANAAAQNLASNSGMTVRLISPQVSNISQPGLTYLVPSQGVQQKMIFPSSMTSPIRGNVKTIIMKNGNPGGNLIIPIQPGVAVSSSVVHMPAQTTQQAVQQIFTTAGTGGRTSTVSTIKPQQRIGSHPAPLPAAPAQQASNPQWKMIPPKPNLKIQHQNNGIVLSWNMVLGPVYADIASYQLFAYQEGSAPPSPNLWKKVGDVKALPLPMACTLTQFVSGHRYHFTVRAVDVHGRVGPFSLQGSIRLGN